MSRTHDIRPGTATDMHDPSLQVRMAVLETVNDYLAEVDKIELGDVYVVSYCYILSNFKATVSTTIPDDRYYEVTHEKSGDTYVDVYHKERQRVFKFDDPIHNL